MTPSDSRRDPGERGDSRELRRDVSGGSLDPAQTFIALVHHPVLDQSGATVATAITNLDIHDIARASRTFGLAGYLLVTPIEAQRALALRIVGHWTRGPGRARNDKRTAALELVSVVPSVEEAVAHVEARLGRPFVVATSARPQGAASTETLRSGALAGERPVLLLLGTGWGLAPPVFERVDAVLGPIRGPGEYNHLSVRSAAAILLDRLFGNRESPA